MNEREFVDLINKNGFYDTPEDLKYGLFSKVDILFYLRLWRVIHNAAQHLSKDFTPDNWKIYSYAAHALVEAHRGKIHITGLENVKNVQQPCVYVANHMSLVETFMIPVLLLDFSDVTIILKEDLMKYPSLGKLLKALKPICVARKNPREDLQLVLKEGAKSLQEKKRSLLIFPQSTRTPEFNPSDFNTLGVKLAQRNNVPCVPIALKTDFLTPGKIVRDLGKIDPSKHLHFKIGKPVTVTKENSRQVHADICNFISSSIEEWNR
jgi:1-acyl-sn-glycerol-3-phosphate acyltransferase